MRLSENMITKVYSPKAQELISQDNPTFIGTVAGIKFFENPRLGDEAPLISKRDGKWVSTCFWEVPELEELI
jgi:hypothetical protein